MIAEDNMMKEKRNEQLSRDFMHLSQEISRDSCASIPYELITILEACINNPSYKDLASENMVAYLRVNEKVRSGLQSIIDDNSKDFLHIRDIAKEILDQAEVLRKNKM